MRLYRAKVLKRVAELLPKDKDYLWENDLEEFFSPFADTYYIVDGELKLCEKGIAPTVENVAYRAHHFKSKGW